VSCFECGATPTEEHHVVPSALGGTRTVPLCRVHHLLVHGAGQPLAGTRISRLRLALWPRVRVDVTAGECVEPHWSEREIDRRLA
jgi:hypothetical protein